MDKALSLKINIRNLFLGGPAFILFFLMLFVPTSYRMIKAIFLALVLTIISISMFKNKFKLKLHPLILYWTLFYVTIGLFFVFTGILRSAPGAIRVTTVYVVWPLIYMFFVAGCASEWILKKLTRVLVIATIAISIYSLSYILYSSGKLPVFLYIQLDQGQAIGFYKGFMEFNLYSLSSMLFLVPYTMAAFLTYSKKCIGLTKVLLWFALLLSVLIVFLSGRRALLLVFLLAPFFIWILIRFTPNGVKLILSRRFKKYIAFVVALGCFVGVVLVIGYNWNPNDFVNMFLEGFDFAKNTSALARYEQFYALLNGWSQYPLLGAGHGAAIDLRRSIEQPWAYELSYIALLYQTGLIGFLLYSSGVVWLFWMGVRMVQSGHELGYEIFPILVGTACFLVANATNPYLAKYDYLWVIFLPVAFINFWLLQKNI